MTTLCWGWISLEPPLMEQTSKLSPYNNIQGIPYLMCPAGETPTANLPCELGVEASDLEDGLSIQDYVSQESIPECPATPKTWVKVHNHPHSDSDAAGLACHPLAAYPKGLPPSLLKPQVLICPPAACQSNGTCSGSYVGDKDIISCGIDTSNSTAIGTTFTLTFEVYDSSGLHASVSRAITVVTPCPPDAELCSDGHCRAAMSCDLVERLAAMPVGIGTTEVEFSSTVLVLMPSSYTNFSSATPSANQTVLSVYGQPAPFSLLPCASALNLTADVQCAVAAVQRFQNGSDVDVSAGITVEDVSRNVTTR